MRTVTRGIAITLCAMLLGWFAPMHADAAAATVKQGDKIEKAYAGLVLVNTDTAPAQAVCGPDVMAGTLYQRAYGAPGSDFDHATVLAYGYVEQAHPFVVFFYAGKAANESAIAAAVDDAQGIVDAIYDAPPFPHICDLAKP